jgi:hypothetical protein
MQSSAVGSRKYKEIATAIGPFMRHGACVRIGDVL